MLSVAASAPPLHSLKPIDQGTSSAVYAADGTRLGFIQSDEIRTPIPLEPDSRVDAGARRSRSRTSASTSTAASTTRASCARRQEPRGRQDGRGRIDDHPAARAQPLRRPRADARAQDPRGAARARSSSASTPSTGSCSSYLNSVPYGTVDGQTAVGVQAAAQTFFAKPAKNLTLEESALLAGLPQAPSELTRSRTRRPRSSAATRCSQDGEARIHLQAACDEAHAQPTLRVRQGDLYTKIREPFFFDYVKQQLIDRFGVNTVRKGGLKVYTTIDPKLQQAGRNAIDSTLYYPTDPSSAVVAIDPRTGYIRAMASSSNTATRSTTSPRRATASPARRSRPSC